MEGVLTSLAELASHGKLVETSPINDYSDGLRSRWGAVLEDAEKRVELSTSGHTHLGCYADQSTTFDEWLSFTEKKLTSTSTIPGECLERVCVFSRFAVHFCVNSWQWVLVIFVVENAYEIC